MHDRLAENVGRLLGQGRVDIKARAELKTRHPGQPRKNFNVPAEVGIDRRPGIRPPASSERRRVENKVVVRVIQAVAYAAKVFCNASAK